MHSFICSSLTPNCDDQLRTRIAVAMSFLFMRRTTRHRYFHLGRSRCRMVSIILFDCLTHLLPCHPELLHNILRAVLCLLQPITTHSSHSVVYLFSSRWHCLKCQWIRSGEKKIVSNHNSLIGLNIIIIIIIGVMLKALVVALLVCLAVVECAKPVTKLQIGVKKRPETCTMKSKQGDQLSMHYTVFFL